MDLYKGHIPILDDEKGWQQLAFPSGVGFGAVPRDYRVDPVEMFETPDDMHLIPESELDARYDEQEALKSSLEHFYLSGPGGGPAWENLDQNGHGYCWAYSTGHCVMLARMVQGEPYVRMNPHSVAAIIKGGRDEGGWCGLSAKFLREHGIASEEEWPLHSRDVQRYDTPKMRAHMKQHITPEQWVDLQSPVYDVQLTEQQVWTAAFLNQPMANDFDWWGHSVCCLRYVRVERGSWGRLILNSWKGWGRHGLAVLRGSKAKAVSSVAIRTTLPSVS